METTAAIPKIIEAINNKSLTLLALASRHAMVNSHLKFKFIGLESMLNGFL
jgi:hypothetical protein